MLILHIQNISERAEGRCDYSYTVRVNEQIIVQGVVNRHNRAAGWMALVRKIAAQHRPPSKKIPVQ